MKHSLGRSMFVFCFWMMCILMLPFLLAVLITLLYSVT